MGLEQYTGQLDYNKDIRVDTGELEKSIKAGNFEKKDFLETIALYLKESAYQHALEESLKTSLQTLRAQRNPAVVRFVEAYSLQRLFIAAPLQLKENYENIGHAKLVDRFRKNYPKQYAEIEAKAKRDNADRDQLVQRDYVDYEIAMAALDTYFGLLQPEEESIAKEMGFKDLREFNEFAFKYRTAARMIENITNRHHPDIDKKMKIRAEYCKKSTDIAKKTGYDKPGIYAQHLDYYKKYEAGVAAVPGFDPGLYAEAQKVLEDGYVGLNSESALQSRMNANNYVRYCSEEIQKLQKAAGPLMIKGFLSFNRQMNGLQETYERKYKISAVQAEIEKYTATCDGFYALNQISLADAGRVGKVLTRMEESGLNKKYQDITALYRYIADPTNKDGPFRAIVLDRKLKQAEQLKKQQEIDASYTWIRKTFGSGVYTMLNAGAGLRNGFYDAIVGTGSALGAMIISFFKDDKAMGSTLRLKESWDAFGKIGLASEMSEPLVKDGKLNMRFDNTVNQLAQVISQMIALLGGGEARARGAEKAGAGLLKLTTKTGGVLVQNASRIGLFSNAMIQQAGTNYLSAKAQGLTDMESVAYSLFSSAGSAGLELLSPNDVVTGKFSGVLLSLIGKEGKARIMTKLALFAMTALAAGKNLAHELKDEVIQEETQGLFTSVFNYMVNSGADINLDVNMSWADLGSTAIITALTTGVVSGSGSYQQGKIDAGNMTQSEKENLKKQIAAVPEMRLQYTKQIDEMLVKPPAGVDVEALRQLKKEINKEHTEINHEHTEGAKNAVAGVSRETFQNLDASAQQNISDYEIYAKEKGIDLVKERQKTLENAKAAVGRDIYDALTDQQREAIRVGHLIGFGEIGKDGKKIGRETPGESNYTNAQIERKRQRGIKNGLDTQISYKGKTIAIWNVLMKEGIRGFSNEGLTDQTVLDNYRQQPGNPERQSFMERFFAGISLVDIVTTQATLVELIAQAKANFGGTEVFKGWQKLKDIYKEASHAVTLFTDSFGYYIENFEKEKNGGPSHSVYNRGGLKRLYDELSSQLAALHADPEVNIDAMPLVKKQIEECIAKVGQLMSEYDAGIYRPEAITNELSATEMSGVSPEQKLKEKRNAFGDSEEMVKLKNDKDRILNKGRRDLKPVDMYKAYLDSINKLFIKNDPHAEAYDFIPPVFIERLTDLQADTIHQMHSLSWSASLGKVVDQNGNVATYPGVERVTSESELNAFKARQLSRVILNKDVVRRLLEYKVCGAANSPGTPITSVIDTDATEVAGSTTAAGVQPTTITEVTDQTATDQTITDQTATTETSIDSGEVQLNNLLTEAQAGMAEVDALAEEIQQEASPEKQKNALVRYLKLFVKQLQKARDVTLQAKFAVTDLVTAKSIADGLDAMITFCQAIITGIDLSRKMTESRWNTYKFADELKNTGGIAKLKINIWWRAFPSLDMMSAHDKGLRSVMKDVLEYFCYVLVRVKVTLEDIQVTEEHELPEKERTRSEKLEKYEKKFRDDIENKFNEGLEREFGLKAKVENAMKDIDKIVSQIKLTLAKIDEDRSEAKSELSAIENAIEEISTPPSDSEEVKKRIRNMESSLVKCEIKLEKLKKKWERRAAIKMHVVTLVSPSKLTKVEYDLIRDEMLKTEKKKIKKKGITLDLSLEVRKEKARVWKEAKKELQKTNKKFKLTEARKNAIREAHMRGYGTEKPLKNPDGTPVLDEKGNPVMAYPQAVKLTKTRIMMEATEPDGSRCFTNEEIKRLGDKGIFGFLDRPRNKNAGQDTKVDLVSLKRPGLVLYVDSEKTQGVRIKYREDQLPPTYYVEGLGGLDTYRDRVFVQGGEGAQERAKKDVARLVMEKTGITIVVKGDNDWEVHGVYGASDGGRIKAEGDGKQSSGQGEGAQEKKPSRVKVKKPPRIKVKEKNKQGEAEDRKPKTDEVDNNVQDAQSENLDIEKVAVELVEMPADEVDTEYGTKHYEVKVKYDGKETKFEKFELFLHNPPTLAFVINVEKAADGPRGVGVLAYIQLGKELQKRGIQLAPSPAMTPGGKKLWARLYEMGYAEKNANYEYGYVFVDKDANKGDAIRGRVAAAVDAALQQGKVRKGDIDDEQDAAGENAIEAESQVQGYETRDVATPLMLGVGEDTFTIAKDDRDLVIKGPYGEAIIEPGTDIVVGSDTDGEIGALFGRTAGVVYEHFRLQYDGATLKIIPIDGKINLKREEKDIDIDKVAYEEMNRMLEGVLVSDVPKIQGIIDIYMSSIPAEKLQTYVEGKNFLGALNDMLSLPVIQGVVASIKNKYGNYNASNAIIHDHVMNYIINTYMPNDIKMYRILEKSTIGLLNQKQEDNRGHKGYVSYRIYTDNFALIRTYGRDYKEPVIIQTTLGDLKGQGYVKMDSAVPDAVGVEHKKEDYHDLNYTIVDESTVSKPGE